MREAVDDQKVFKGVLQIAAERQEPGGTVLFDLEHQVKKGDVRRITFSISDVDRAKLDPLLDFKGRKR